MSLNPSHPPHPGQGLGLGWPQASGIVVFGGGSQGVPSWDPKTLQGRQPHSKGVRTAAEVLAASPAHTTGDGRRAKFKGVWGGSQRGGSCAGWRRASLRPPAREVWGVGMFSAAAPCFSLGSYGPGREKRLFHQRETTLGAELQLQRGRPLPCMAPTCSQQAPTGARTLQQPHRAHTHLLAALAPTGHVCTRTAGHMHTAGHMRTAGHGDTAVPLPSQALGVHTRPPPPPQPPSQASILHSLQRFGVIKVPFEGAYNFYLKIPFQDNFLGCEPGTKRVCASASCRQHRGLKKTHSQKLGAALGPKSCLWPHWPAKPDCPRVSRSAHVLGSREALSR